MACLNILIRPFEWTQKSQTQFAWQRGELHVNNISLSLSLSLFLPLHLSSTGMPYTHIASPMPEYYRTVSSIPRGVANRRAAINWIRQNGRKPGILYFGDDDNTFDLRLFDEIRSTKRVSMFPVGLIGLYAVSTPVVKNVS